jgi:hypothetical protein
MREGDPLCSQQEIAAGFARQNDGGNRPATLTVKSSYRYLSSCLIFLSFSKKTPLCHLSFIFARDLCVHKRMASSGMLRRVPLVRPDVSAESSASFIRVTRICELGTTLAVTRNTKYLFAACVVDYEECRLLGYRKPVRTSQETLRLRYRAQPVNAM